MPLGHLQRRMMSGASPVYLDEVTGIGGTLRMMHPFTDAGPYSTSVAGTVEELSGVHTNGTLKGNATVTAYQDADAHTAPSGENGVGQIANNGSSFINFGDFAGTFTGTAGGWFNVWFSLNADSVANITDASIITLQNQGSKYTQVRVRPASNTVNLRLDSVSTDTQSFTGNNFLSPTMISIVETYAGSDTTTKVYFNGVLTLQGTKTWSGPTLWVNTPTNPWLLRLSQSGIGTPNEGYWTYASYSTNVAPSAAQLLSLYNTFKDK